MNSQLIDEMNLNFRNFGHLYEKTEDWITIYYINL